MTGRQNQGFWYWFSRSALWTLALTAAGMIIFYPYIFAWLTVDDPTPEKRLAYLNNVLDQCCVSARPRSGRMVTLRRSDIKEIGESRCAREYHCVSYGKYCRSADVTWYCTYDIKDQTGEPATAILKAPPNAFYEPFADKHGAWRREPYSPHNMAPDEAEQQLCRLGYCRRPSAD
jgi:hypothetical protein